MRSVKIEHTAILNHKMEESFDFWEFRLMGMKELSLEKAVEITDNVYCADNQ